MSPTYTTLTMALGFLFLAALAVFQLIAAGWLIHLARRLHQAEEIERRLVTLSGSLAILKKDFQGLSESYDSYVARNAVRQSRERKRAGSEGAAPSSTEESEKTNTSFPEDIFFPTLHGG